MLSNNVAVWEVVRVGRVIMGKNIYKCKPSRNSPVFWWCWKLIKFKLKSPIMKHILFSLEIFKVTNYYNQGTNDLPSLEGDVVRMRPFRLGQKTWEKATVVKRYDEQSCEVKRDTRSYCRNRVDLKQQQPIPQNTTVISEPAPDTIMNQDPTTAKPNNEIKTSQSTSQPQEPQQDTPSTVSQRPKRTSRSPTYLKDYVH